MRRQPNIKITASLFGTWLPKYEFRYLTLIPIQISEKFHSLIKTALFMRAHDVCGKIAGMEGIEPTTCGLTVRRSNQLSYIPI